MADVLYELVKSLSKSEKGYFRKYSLKGRQNQNINYLMLFDAIDQCKVWNEVDLISQFNDKKFTNNFSEAKAYLRKLILKALRDFHSSRSYNTQMREGLDYIELLYNRGQYKLCQKYLDQNLKLAKKLEHYHNLLEMFSWQRKLILQKQHSSIAKAHSQLLEREHLIFEQLQIEVKYQNYYARLSEISRYKASYTAENLASALDNVLPEIATPLLPKSGFFARTLYNRVWGIYHQLSGAFQEAWDYSKANQDLWETNQNMAKYHTHFYKTDLANFLSISLLTKHTINFRNYVSLLRSIPNHTFEDEVKTFQTSYYLELLFLLNTYAFKEAEELVPELEKGLQQYESNINKGRLLVFYFQVALLFFIRQSLESSLKWLNFVLLMPGSESRKDIQSFSKLMQLAIHFDLENHDLLEHLFRSVKRFFRKENPDHLYAVTFVTQLQRIWTKPISERKTGFQELLKLLSLIDTSPMGLLELRAWVTHHISNNSIELVLKEQHKENI